MSPEDVKNQVTFIENIKKLISNLKLTSSHSATQQEFHLVLENIKTTSNKLALFKTSSLETAQNFSNLLNNCKTLVEIATTPTQSRIITQNLSSTTYAILSDIITLASSISDPSSNLEVFVEMIYENSNHLINTGFNQCKTVLIIMNENMELVKDAVEEVNGLLENENEFSEIEGKFVLDFLNILHSIRILLKKALAIVQGVDLCLLISKINIESSRDRELESYAMLFSKISEKIDNVAYLLEPGFTDNMSEIIDGTNILGEITSHLIELCLISDPSCEEWCRVFNGQMEMRLQDLQ